MTQIMRLQVAGLLLLSFIAYNYLSAKRRKTSSHLIFSALLILTMINVVFDLAFLIFMDNMTMVSVSNRLYMLTLSVICCLFRGYIDTTVDEMEGEDRHKKKWFWTIPAFYAIVLCVVYPFTFYLADDGIVHFTDGWHINSIYAVIGFYVIAAGVCFGRHYRIFNKRTQLAFSIAYAIYLTTFLLQLVDTTNTITSMGLTATLLAIYLVSENADVLLIEQLQYEKDRANAANASKSSFIAHVSHEIRTPINAILGMNEIILRETSEKNVRGYAEDISSAAYSLYGIINDVLDMSKMDSGKMDILPGKYILPELIYDVVMTQKPKLEDKPVEFIVDISPEIPSEYFGDEIRIKQVLNNIVSNAVKYTNEGFIRLSIYGEVKGDTIDLKFSLKDTGIGIREEDINKLFVAFERIEESRNRNIEGTGLGMTITSTLLRFMGSKLSVDSVYGEGSVFSFVLTQGILNREPVGDFNEYIKKHENVTVFDFKAPDARILVVDDNALNRRVFSSLLKNTQMDIREASGGVMCLDMVKKDKYDLIFMDHLMPDMDGIETMNRCKTMDDNLNLATPVIMLTANAVGDMLEEYRHAGFAAHLSKPIFGKELEKIIRTFLPAEKILSNERKSSMDSDAFDTLPTIKGINWNVAATHLPGKEVMVSTLREFHKSIDSEADAIEKYASDIENGDNVEQFRIKVHALKGTAGIIGAEMLSESARELELAAKDREYDHIRARYQTILEYYRSFKDKLSMFAQEEEEPKKSEIDFPQVISLVKMVGLEMEELNRDNAYEALDDIEIYEYPEEINNDINSLREAVDELELDAVERIVSELVVKLRKLRDLG